MYFVINQSRCKESLLERLIFTGVIYKMANEKLMMYSCYSFKSYPLKQSSCSKSLRALPFISILVISRLLFCYFYEGLIKASYIFWKNLALLLQNKILYVAVLLFTVSLVIPPRRLSSPLV